MVRSASAEDMSQTAEPGPELDAGAKAILQRHADWWRGKGMLYAKLPDAPLGDLWLPLADGSLASEDLDVLPEMLDVERLAGSALEPGPLEFMGDQIATRQPYVRIPWVEAILGCPIRATIRGGSMRTRSFISDWTEWQRRATHRDVAWFDLLTRLTGLMVARSGGRYAVAQTLMRGPSDLAEAILGSELLCLSIYDHPRELRRFLDTVTEAFLEILWSQLERIPRIEGGCVNPFGVWAPGTTVRTQCDASAFLSPDHYARWFLPYDVRISEAVDYATIHLHSGSLHTVDALLKVERPQAIQVSLDPPPSGPPVEALLPVFRNVLAYKPLIVDGTMTPEEVQFLFDELPPDGLYIRARSFAQPSNRTASQGTSISSRLSPP